MRLTQRIVKDDFVAVYYSGEVTPLPGCPDIAVSHGLYCHNGPGSGAGHKAAQERMLQIKELGYSAVLCTVVVDNHAQIKILTKAGYHIGKSVYNRRTKNHIVVCYKEL